VIGKLSVEGAGSAQPETTGGTPDEASESPEAAANEPETAVAPGGERTLTVPDIGDFEDVDVIEVHVSEGQQISAEDSLITLETDKASMDVPAEVGGTVKSVLVSVGDKVSKDSPIAVIDAVGAAAEGAADKPVPAPAPQQEAKPAAPAPAPAQPAKQAASATPGKLPPINEAGFARAHASPSVRKLARELGVDLEQVKGSGSKQRVLHDDVKAFVKAILTGQAAAPAGTGLPQTPKVDFEKFGEIELQPLTRIQKISGPRLQASWINLPHVTQHDLADITELEARRQKLKGPAKEKGIPLTPLAFILKACVAALHEFPRVNASLSHDGEISVSRRIRITGWWFRSSATPTRKTSTSSQRSSVSCRWRLARASSRRTRCRARRSPCPASGASAAPHLRPLSIRRRSRFSVSRGTPCSPSGTARNSGRG
jgi:pyruvate dehydrogenase E2 component (dihydrolipoamide acetyltransferase)